MENRPQTPQEKALAQKHRTHELALQGGLVQVARRVLKDNGIVPPDGPMLVGIIIEGTERLQGLSEERVAAIRNLGFLAMDKKRLDGNKKVASEQEKKAARPKYFYQNNEVDPNLNI